LQDIGTLLVQVTTSRASLPVRDATVVVTSAALDGRHELVCLTQTDESGLTEPIQLPTPSSPDGGQTPGGSVPFAMYSLWVEHPEYTLAFVENFQVFPGIESVQQVSLVPLDGLNADVSHIDQGGDATAQPL
jgi:hypothetical protein